MPLAVGQRYRGGALTTARHASRATGRGGPAPAGRKLAVGDRSACPAVLTGRPGKRQEIRLGPAVPCGGGRQRRGPVVPAQQAFVEEHGCRAAKVPKSAQSGSASTWWATISAQARETVW